MSKLSKLRSQPGLFFFDAFKNNIPENLKKKLLPLFDDNDFKSNAQILNKTVKSTASTKIIEKFKDVLFLEGEVYAKNFLNWITLSEGINVSKKLYVTFAEYQIENGNFQSVKEIIELLKKNDCLDDALYCEGLYYFYKKDINKSIDKLLCMLINYNYKNKVAIFLLAESYILSEKKDLARKILLNDEMLKQSKSWLFLANMVEKESELLDLIVLHKECTVKNLFSRYNVKINEYLALAALRVGQKEVAKNIWREINIYFYSQQKTVNQNINYTKNYNSDKAEIALIELNNLFKSNGLEFFLVSGTLLGAIRENKLLGHDNDIDVGVFNDISSDVIYKMIRGSERFFELKSRSDKIIRLKHINGINIDIFYHYEEEDVFWHSGVKVKWKNTKFNIKEMHFLGSKFMIPSNAELYLSENYGEGWVEPQVDFDSTFDTPNGYVIDETEAIIYSYKMLIKYRDNPDKVQYYLDHLAKLQDVEFADKIRNVNCAKNNVI